jgi:hypothetical protein
MNKQAFFFSQSSEFLPDQNKDWHLKCTSFFKSAFNHVDPSKRVDRMKLALAISLLIVICNAVLSCGPTSILLVNLKTNDLRYCPVGEQSDACIKQLEDLGYIRADRLTPAQKATLGVSLPF